MSTTTPSGLAPLSSSPPEAWEPLQRLARLATRPVEQFLRIQAASGILLLAAAGIALGWANSRWSEAYFALWHTPIGVRVGSFGFERPLEWFVNDGLMVLFFFVVGLEIRRELHHGQLAEWRRAALPAAAALGGMIAPAGLYLILAGAEATRRGWGVPMATDIAFALGILALLGKRVPAGLRVLLLALAVIDDLGAIVVIALFYSKGIALSGLLAASGGVVAIYGLQRFGVRAKLAYIAPAVIVWAGFYFAGIHPTIAGVVVGLLTPARTWLGPDGFVDGVKGELERLKRAPERPLSPDQLAGSLRHVDVARREAVSPSEGLIETLHPWVAFAIMPLFALTNTGVRLTGSLTASTWPIGAGIVVGLLVGKPLGVLAASGLALRFRVASLPDGLSPRHLVVLGLVAGVGLTMALFVAQLAFENEAMLAMAKIGVLGASCLAAITALGVGCVVLPQLSAGDAGEG